MAAPWSVGQAATVTKMNNPSGRLAGGAASLRSGFGGVIYHSEAIGANVGAGEDTLFTQSLAAAILAADGDSLEGYASGFFANNANNKRLRLKFGATTILDSGAIGYTNASWILRWTITRLTATTQTAIASLLISGNNPQVASANPTETLSGAITLALTGEATADNDITMRPWKVWWWPVGD